MNQDHTLQTELITAESQDPIRELSIEEVFAVAGGPEVVNDGAIT